MALRVANMVAKLLGFGLTLTFVDRAVRAYIHVLRVTPRTCSETQGTAFFFLNQLYGTRPGRREPRSSVGFAT